MEIIGEGQNDQENLLVFFLHGESGGFAVAEAEEVADFDVGAISDS